MFTGDLAFLSNFHAEPYRSLLTGTVVRSGEHDFNAAKTLDPAQRDFVLAAPTPGEAKRRGRRVTLRPGWDAGWRVRAMQSTLLGKFADPVMRQRLADTGGLVLVESNTWHDNFWGDCLCGRPACAPAGVNMLGELLMALRCRS